MPSIWIECLGRNYESAFDFLAAAIRDCTDELWDTPMWPVPGELFGSSPTGPDGKPVTDPAVRDALVQRRSTPWSVAWHALECVDYDLVGEFGPWAPPAPFNGNPHWMLTALPRGWTRADMLVYVDYCRQRVRDTLADMTDEKAATPLPPQHRKSGQAHGFIITDLVGHTIEHASQIRQHITAGGVAQPS